MFSFQRPTATQVQTRIAAAFGLPTTGTGLLTAEAGLTGPLPFLFAHDVSVTTIGHGEKAFFDARHAFERWAMFNLGWAFVANPEGRIVTGQLVAVQAQTMALWTINVSRIVEVVDEPHRFGFVYATTDLHVEEGEERFLLELDPTAGDVVYKLEAVSRPRHILARLGLPMTRLFQHRFARDSHRQMVDAVRQADTLEA